MSLKHKSTLENAESFVYLYFLNTYRINELKENAATSKSLLIFIAFGKMFSPFV